MLRQVLGGGEELSDEIMPNTVTVIREKGRDVVIQEDLIDRNGTF